MVVLNEITIDARLCEAGFRINFGEETAVILETMDGDDFDVRYSGGVDFQHEVFPLTYAWHPLRFRDACLE